MALFGMISTGPSREYTALALESFIGTTSFTAADRFLLIDNDGSTEPLVSLLEQLPIPAERYVNDEPRGFAANFNHAIDCARRERQDLYLLNNDLVFTPGWREPLEVPLTAIISPLSNREVQYAQTVVVPSTSHVLELFLLRTNHTLEEYRENQAAFHAIFAAHRKHIAGMNPVFVVPFFCTRIPLPILDTLGYLDERFGRGGGEDFDYCLRAHLAGIPVVYALSSFILHFGGKSSWSGVETSREQTERETHFRNVFEGKWGTSLFSLILREDYSVISSVPELQALERAGQIAAIVRSLLGERTVPPAV